VILNWEQEINKMSVNVVLVCSFTRRKNGVMHLHNEYFFNAVKGQNKATELIGYIFPAPLSQ